MYVNVVMCVCVCVCFSGGEGPVLLCAGKYWSTMGHHCSCGVAAASQAVHARSCLFGNV